MNGRIGVLVEVNCESDFVARNDEFKELVKNICLQIAAANPKYIAPEDVPAEVLEQEKEIVRAQFKDSKKPAEIIEKIVQGKLGKFYEEVCLLDQVYIKDDKLTDPPAHPVGHRQDRREHQGRPLRPLRNRQLIAGTEIAPCRSRNPLTKGSS